MHYADWLDWDLVLSGHLLRRMRLRKFTEVDLREMLSVAWILGPGEGADRWVLRARLGRERWEVVVEVDESLRRLVVVTAYRVSWR